ncbi:MAG: hypothetical protein QNL04_10990 [SAR324 cluster bacterium]|nr:hypothetical protein [SAR324 cluster bacterium]
MIESLTAPHLCMAAITEDGMNIKRVIDESAVPIFLGFDVYYTAKNLETGKRGVTVRCNAFCIKAVVQNPLSLEHIPERHRSLILCELALAQDQNAEKFMPNDIPGKSLENYNLVGNSYVWELVGVDEKLLLSKEDFELPQLVDVWGIEENFNKLKRQNEFSLNSDGKFYKYALSHSHFTEPCQQCLSKSIKMRAFYREIMLGVPEDVVEDWFKIKISELNSPRYMDCIWCASYGYISDVPGLGTVRVVRIMIDSPYPYGDKPHVHREYYDHYGQHHPKLTGKTLNKFRREMMGIMINHYPTEIEKNTRFSKEDIDEIANKKAHRKNLISMWEKELESSDKEIQRLKRTSYPSQMWLGKLHDSQDNMYYNIQHVDEIIEGSIKEKW